MVNAVIINQQRTWNRHFANDTVTSTNILNLEMIHKKSTANVEYINCSCGKK